MPLPPSSTSEPADLVVDMSPTERSSTGGIPRRRGLQVVRQPARLNDPAHCVSEMFRRAEIPAANLHSNARGLDRSSPCSPAGRCAEARPTRSWRSSAVPCPRRGRRDGASDRVRARFEHTIPEWRFGPGARTIGHDGSAARSAWWIPTAGLVRLRDEPALVGTRPHRPRWGPVFDALYARRCDGSADLALAAFPVRRADLPLQQLPDGLRGSVGEVDRLRQLVAGEVLAGRR